VSQHDTICSILIAMMVKPTSKTKKTIQARLGSQARAVTTGKKRLTSLKNIAVPFSNKHKKSQGSSSNATSLAATSIDNISNFIIDQDVHVVLAGVLNRSFLSLEELQDEVLDNNEDKEDDDNDNDEYFGEECNATVHDGGKSTVVVVCQDRLSASPSSANVAANIDPDLSTLSRNGLIAAATEALRVQRSLEHEAAALQEAMFSMQNQSQVNSSAISGYQEEALWANQWLKRKGRISASLLLSWFIMLSKKYSGHERCSSS
jgi:hypothetical protein